MLKRIIHNRLNKIIQAESNPNRVVVMCCRMLGFPLKNIRNALVALNDTRIQKMGNGEVSSPVIYNVKNGTRKNGKASEKAKEIFAASFGLDKDELFEKKQAA